MLAIFCHKNIQEANPPWKHNRFEAYKVNTADTASRSLPPGTNGAAATLLMLHTINNDKKRVTELCGQQCVQLWLEAAKLCGLTYECTSTPGRHLVCRKPRDIGLAWKQNSGPLNCKRIAFIFDFYGTEIYRRAFSTTHQEATTRYVMATLGIAMDVPPAAMCRGQKTCVQQQYSATSHIRKNNILRVGRNNHDVRVSLEQGSEGTNKNWKRPKEVFFNIRSDPTSNQKSRLVEKVSVP
jgi:hypothetical protein